MAIIAGRARSREEEGESGFVSMTDLVVSFLFIVLVLLAFFATQFSPEDPDRARERIWQLEQAEWTMVSLRRQLAQARERIGRLDWQLGIARARARDLERERGRLDGLVAERDRTILALRAEIAVLTDTVRSLRATATDLRSALEAASERVRRLKADLERSETERAAALARARALAADARALERRLAASEREIGALRRRIARLERDVEELKQPDPLAAYLERAASGRAVLMDLLAGQIVARLPGIRVTVVAADGVIRFRGDDLFGSARWRILPDSTADRMARAVADALADTLPCYTVGPRAAFDAACNEARAAIETIQIEGHTDDIPIGRQLLGRECMRDNLALSACRGAETLRAATGRYRPELMEFLNLRGQPVLSFAGYGAMRPVESGESTEARAANRRIDIRFILQTPRNLREVDEIRERLTRNRPYLPTLASGGAP